MDASSSSLRRSTKQFSNRAPRNRNLQVAFPRTRPPATVSDFSLNLRIALMLKKLCQCLGIASLILAGNYGDLLGGGEDVRMHTPLPLARICYAQIADILILALVVFVVLVPLSRPRLYRWGSLLLA